MLANKGESTYPTVALLLHTVQSLSCPCREMVGSRQILIVPSFSGHRPTPRGPPRGVTLPQQYQYSSVTTHISSSIPDFFLSTGVALLTGLHADASLTKTCSLGIDFSKGRCSWTLLYSYSTSAYISSMCARWRCCRRAPGQLRTG